MAGILLATTTMYFAVRSLQEISYCNLSGSQYRYVLLQRPGIQAIWHYDIPMWNLWSLRPGMESLGKAYEWKEIT